jgi:hypothetical protein
VYSELILVAFYDIHHHQLPTLILVGLRSVQLDFHYVLCNMMPDVNQFSNKVGAYDCRCNRDQRLNLPSEARTSSK